jgi:hypothetical protein
MADDDIPRFKDFSLSEEPVVFKIGDDDFPCHPEVSLDTLVELATLRSSNSDGVDIEAQMRRMHDFFDYVIADPGMGERFRERTAVPTKEKPNPKPIGMRHIVPIMQWLMEVYGLRPTQPSSESADGSASTGDSSTDGASETGSMF